MRRQWRMVWCLIGMVSLCWVGGRAMGQAEFSAPQYPQYVQYPQGTPPVVPAAPAAAVTLTSGQLNQLLGPIALYPDPLLSLLLPAATYPQDVVAAEQWLQATPGATEADIAAQHWDASIKGMVHYPSVLEMMSNQMNWTQAVGAAFLNQQKDVLASIQQLRAQAQAAQNLQTTSQQQVVADQGSILVEPTDPNTMYVPQYDANAVYSSASPVSYGAGYPIGLWCDNAFDWGGQCVVTGGGWYSGWNHPTSWDQNPPAWNRRPAGWVAAPRPWARTSLGSTPRLTSAGAARLGLNRQGGAAGTTRGSAILLPIGRQPAPASSRNIFAPTQSRNAVQSAAQRARTPIRPAVTARSAPRQSAPAPRAAARAAPAMAAPRSAPSNVFRGGSAGATRAQSARGNASSGGRR
ncbi:MAG: DUF3300 domain-containing protein [Candidatus Acidiferrales bacterium]|jgi:hypothetical protein